MIQPSNRLLVGAMFHDLIDQGRWDQHCAVIINNDDIVR